MNDITELLRQFNPVIQAITETAAVHRHYQSTIQPVGDDIKRLCEEFKLANRAINGREDRAAIHAQSPFEFGEMDTPHDVNKGDGDSKRPRIGFRMPNDGNASDGQN